MTVQYRPSWNDGLTHADAERIRQDGLAWAAQLLRDRVDEFKEAAAAFDAHQAELRHGEIDGAWRQLRFDRDVAAYRVVGTAETLLRYAPTS